MRSGRWIAAVLIVAACGSPMDDANAVIDAVVERHEVLNEDLIAEAQGIRERQMEHEVCRQVPEPNRCGGACAGRSRCRQRTP